MEGLPVTRGAQAGRRRPHLLLRTPRLVGHALFLRGGCTVRRSMPWRIWLPGDAGHRPRPGRRSRTPPSGHAGGPQAARARRSATGTNGRSPSVGKPAGTAECCRWSRAEVPRRRRGATAERRHEAFRHVHGGRDGRLLGGKRLRSASQSRSSAAPKSSGCHTTAVMPRPPLPAPGRGRLDRTRAARRPRPRRMRGRGRGAARRRRRVRAAPAGGGRRARRSRDGIR
jgi:hypothetical protein